MSCSVCNIKVDRKLTNLNCDTCKKIFHPPCVSVNDNDLEYMRQGKIAWKCNGCVAASKGNRDDTICASPKVLPNSSVVPSGILEKIEIELRDIKKKNTEYSENITNRLNALQSAMDRIEILTAENKLLKDEVKSMQYKLNSLEQSQHDNAIEICGVPYMQGENINQKVCDVLSLGFNMPINLDDIDFSYRKKSKNKGKSSQPGSIYVKFTRKRTKVSVMSAKKTTTCNNTALGLPGTFKIYFNESLSYHNRCLFYEAKLVKNSKDFKYLWVKNGIIYMRKAEGSELIKITCESDLEHL